MATLYVNASTGDDTRSYVTAQNSATPWATIGRAAWGSSNRATPNASEAAAAGDTVLIAAGTYTTVGTNVRYEPSLNPVNSGSAGNRITFRGVGTVEIRLSSGEGPAIGAYNAKNYITWDHFYIDEQYVHALPDMGPVVIASANYITLTNLTIIGREPTWYPYGDNHNGIRLEDSVGSSITNNYISGVDGYTGGLGVNAAGIMTYLGLSSNTTISNNEITGCGTGIYLKNAWGSNGGGITVQKNYLYGNARGIRVAETQSSTISQNLIINGIGAEASGFQFGEAPLQGVSFYNNTVYNMVYGWVSFSTDGTGPTAWSSSPFQNNIFHTVTTNGWVDGNPYIAALGADRNVYYAVTNYAESGNAHTTLAAWRAATPFDDNSSTVDPEFVNAAGGNFRLASNGQPALTLGIDALDLDGDSSTVDAIPAGCYVTGNEQIGIETNTPAATQASVLLFVG